MAKRLVARIDYKRSRKRNKAMTKRRRKREVDRKM